MGLFSRVERDEPSMAAAAAEFVAVAFDAVDVILPRCAAYRRQIIEAGFGVDVADGMAAHVHARFVDHVFDRFGETVES